jgi:two-component system, OmpR family, sensor kinase
MSRVEVIADPVAPSDPPPSSYAPLSGAPPPAAPAPRRLGPRSLTSKLVVGVVSLVIVLVLIVGGATYFALKSFLTTKFNDQLTSTTSQNVAFFDRCVQSAQPTGTGSFGCASGPQIDQEWVLAFDPTTGATYTFSSEYSTDLKALQLPPGTLQSLVANPGQRFNVVQNGTQLRIAARQSNRGDGLLVVTGLSTRDVTRTLHRLLAVELLIGGGAVIVAVFATAYGVRFSLRRLRRVTTTAQEVADELSPEGAGLDRRVPDDEPETEVGQLATSFNTMLAAVETQFAARVESETRMRQFMADASHELRTPLTSIRGYAELARMQRAAGDTSDDNLDRIESEGTRMSRLVEDLLLLARGDADGTDRPARRELLELADLLDDSVRGAQAAFPERVITMEVASVAHLIGDRDQLVRVIRNLINNAAVHTAVDRPIHVRAWGSDAYVTVQVVDGGPGLAPEDAAHVFERFWRADKARTRARGGSGLGLSIVATIVRAHGGTVRFDSTVDTGSTVTVTLPAAQSATE